MKTYLIIIIISCVFVFVRSQWAVFGGARAAEQLFLRTLKQTLRAPMSFFESVPLGRLLNRFTYDVEQLDIKLSQSMSMLIISISWFCSCIGVMLGVMPLMAVVLCPICVVYVASERASCENESEERTTKARSEAASIDIALRAAR